MSSIPLQQIDWDLISNLYGSYEKSRRAREQEEQEKALRYQQMQLVQMQLAEKKREEEYQDSMLPYLQQEESRIRETAAGVQPPPLTPVGPQGLPPEEPGGYRDVGAALKPMPGSPGLSPWFQQPPPEQQFEYEKAQLEGVPNKYEILSRHAMKYGRPKEALAYEEMATPQKIQKINALLQMAIKNNDEGMYRTLLNERRMLEDQIAISEKKYTERDIEGVKTELAMGQKDVKGRVSVPELGGAKLLYSINKYGKGEVQLPNGKWQEYTPTGEIEPLTEGRAGQSPFAKYYALYKSQGMSEEEAVFKAHKMVEESLTRVGRSRIPPGTMDMRLPPGFSFDRMEKRWYYDTPDGPKPVPAGTPTALIGANYQANLQAYKAISTDHIRVKQTIDAAMINADTLLEASKKFSRGQYPPLNQIQQYIQKRVGSQEEQEALQNYAMSLLAFSREYMKVTTGSSRSVAELTAASQKKVDDVLSVFSNWGVIEASIKQAKKEMAAVDVGYVNRKNEAANNLDYQPWRDAPSLPPSIPEKSEYEDLLQRTKGSPPPYPGEEEGEIVHNRTKDQKWVWKNNKWEPFFGKK